MELESIELEAPKQTFRTSAFGGEAKVFSDPLRPITPSEPSSPQVTRSERAFANALVTQRLGTASKEDLERKLTLLMKSDSVRSLISAARSLSEEKRISEQAAFEQILASIRDLTEIWDQLLILEGVQSASTSG
jgi:hypothetical protein